MWNLELWLESDLWPPKSKSIVDPWVQWMFVPNLKKFPQSINEKLCSEELDRRRDGHQTYNASDHRQILKHPLTGPELQVMAPRSCFLIFCLFIFSNLGLLQPVSMYCINILKLGIVTWLMFCHSDKISLNLCIQLPSCLRLKHLRQNNEKHFGAWGPATS